VVRKIKLELIVEDNPLNYHHEEECRRKLDEFMKDLNSEDLKIIELRRRDMSYKQIAESLNINAKRVDNRIQVLRKRLRKDLYDQEGGI
jgi:RNA polymerase sigma factor (sigma-70 family)